MHAAYGFELAYTSHNSDTYGIYNIAEQYDSSYYCIQIPFQQQVLLNVHTYTHICTLHHPIGMLYIYIYIHLMHQPLNASSDSCQDFVSLCVYTVTSTKGHYCNQNVKQKKM